MQIKRVTICCGADDPIYESMSRRIDRYRQRCDRLEQVIKEERYLRGLAQRVIGRLHLRIERLKGELNA